MKKKDISVHDLYALRFLREISLSPDGRKIAYTIEWMDREKNKYFSNLFIVDSDGKQYHYVRGKRNVKNPQWSPDGNSISFVSTDEEKRIQNLWLMPAAGGEAYAITDTQGTFGTYHWLPDGRHIICEFRAKTEDKERVPEQGKPPLYYRMKGAWYKLDGEGILPEEKFHVWNVNVRTGAMEQLTFGKNGDEAPVVSRDGSRIAFVSNRHEDFEEKFQYQDIFVMNADGTHERKITAPAGPKSLPVFSPDGMFIVYIGRGYPDDYAGWRNLDVHMVRFKNGRNINLTKRCGMTFAGYLLDDLGHYARNTPIFSQDGRFVYYTALDKGSMNLYAIDIKEKKLVTVITGNKAIYAFDYDGRGTFALAISDCTNPGDLYMLRERKLKKLTQINDQFLRSHRIANPEELVWKGYNGDSIHGWIMKPPRFNKRKKYPLIVQIHGGPNAAYGFSFFHEFQVLAANGHIVFYSNPHGSQGYGESFAKALHNKWGIPDTQDILCAVQQLKRMPFIDATNIGVMGGSYGGYLTNWLIGHTNIFRYAVTMRSVVNMLSFFSSDFGFTLPKEFKGQWWDRNNFQFYWNMSPLKFVKNMKTPLLILHSEQDHRCPIGQAEELFVALKLLKRDVEMIRFPMEPHGLSRHGSPRRREKRLELMLDFIARHLKKR